MRLVNRAQLCPECSTPLIRVGYGFPSRVMREAAARSEVFIGGCVQIRGGDDPSHYCSQCDCGFRRRQGHFVTAWHPKNRGD